ncbi:MAG: gluconolactonase [Chitinophagaceae bacterium]|nr:gluconolactonase [Chitinophagaceae bacterium]
MHKIFIVSLLIQCLFVNARQNPIPVKGSIKGPFAWKSKIYPGTERNYWLYVPQQYEAAKPACVMVVQDGLSRANGWRLPAVLDSLIETKDIPVMIGIFIDPGIVPSSDTSHYPRFNRSFEYDALGDKYARFLLEEILPEVSRSYNLSKDPDHRSIAGASSGAICAFNVAWERPDAFHRVFSSIGTYVGLRGGHEFPTLIRKTEAKPLRVFLQDGTRDNNIYAGDWWVANQDMLSAFTWAGYEVNHAWGEGGGHDSRHTLTIIADALKWLWKNYPAAVQTHTDSISRTNPTIKDQEWQEINMQRQRPQTLAVNQSGELFFSDQQSIYRNNDTGNAILFATIPGKLAGMSFHSDGRLYVSDIKQHKIISIGTDGSFQDVATGINADLITIFNKGIYFSESGKRRVGFYSFSKKQVQYSTVSGNPTGLAHSAEQTFLHIGFYDQQLGYSFKIMEDGTLAYGQEYTHYHVPYGSTAPGTTAMVTDTANLLYSATFSGIQMSDQLGRINFIISKPAENITDLKIGGTNFNMMYVSCDGRLFRRKINTRGVVSWLPGVKPPKPRL